MSLEQKPFARTLFGCSGRLKPGGAWNSGKPLMDRLWEIVKTEHLQTAGINHWYYGPDQELFVGVELVGPSVPATGLEKKEILFDRYVYWKHTGSFSDLQHGYTQLKKEIHEARHQRTDSSLEIYGHEAGNQSEMQVLIEVKGT